jgi:anti-sigma B factor antagonist
MNLPTEIFGDVIVVHAPDELTNDHADAFAKFISTLEKPSVVLDMDTTESLDSAGLESLVQCQQTQREALGDIKIATTNANNRKILEITRLDEQFDVFHSVIDAVKSYSQ